MAGLIPAASRLAQRPPASIKCASAARQHVVCCRCLHTLAYAKCIVVPCRQSQVVRATLTASMHRRQEGLPDQRCQTCLPY